MRARSNTRQMSGLRARLGTRPASKRSARAAVERLEERVVLAASSDPFAGLAVAAAMRGPVTAGGQDADPLGEKLTADFKAALAGSPVPLSVVAHPTAGLGSLRLTVTGDGVFSALSRVQTLKGPWADGAAAELDLTILASGAGFGHLSARIEGLGADGKVVAVDQADLYATYDAGRVWDSTSSTMDLQTNRLAALLGAGLIDQAAYDSGVQQLAGGVPGWALVSHATAAAGPHALAAPTSVTVSGLIQWTDAAGGKHPVPMAPVEVYETDGTTTTLLTTTPATTDVTGNYTVVVTPDPAFPNLFARAYARGPYSDVHAQAAGSKTYTMDTAPQPIAGAALSLSKDASNSMAKTNERAFAIDAAMFLVGSYTATITGGALPLLQTVFPQVPAPGKNPVSYFSSSPLLMNVRDTAWNQLDVTDHEYGHYVASTFHFLARGIGGSHSVGSNNAPARGKAKGLGLAWNEAWATYFALSGQDAAGASALNIPTYGDHNYDGLDKYSLDTLAADGNAVGEDDEGSVSGVLWNMYLTRYDATSTLQYTDKSIFDIVNGSSVQTVGALWEAAAAKLDTRNKTKLGKIFGDLNIAPVPQEPADNLDLKPSDPIPTFKWKNNGGGTPNPLNEFKVAFYSDDFSKLVFESPVGETTVGADTSSFKPTADEWKTITAGGPRLKWFVEGKNKTDPATPGGALGYYWSQARTLGAPVGIAFVIDVTGSMSDEIGGVRDSLQAFIDLVAATLPPGAEAPTIELLAFRDGPIPIITSNDLGAVRAAVGTLNASGGGDCPEPSAITLQQAVGDLGPGATILLATDASSDPGIDLSAVIAKARDKGITVFPIVSGDCNGIDSPGGPAIASASHSHSLTTTSGSGDRTDEPGCNCNGGTTTATNPVVKSLPPGTVTAPRGATGTPAASPPAEEGGGGPGSDELPLDWIDVTPGAPITGNGTSLATATRLVAGTSTARGLVGGSADAANYFVVNLAAGVRYAVDVNVEAGDAPLVEVLDRDGKTVLTSHQFFQTLDSGQVLSHYTMAVTPSAAGDYYVRFTAGAGSSSPAFYSLRVFADPLADVTSSIEAYSSIASQTGGAIEVRDDVKSGNITAYDAAVFNVMASTLGPAVISASPGTVPQGETLSVQLTARKTNWRQGSTSVSFPAGGIKVLNVTVTSPTTLSALVQVGSDAKLAFQDVVVTSTLGTTTETAKGHNVVQVTGPITGPTLLSVEANSVSRGTDAELFVRGSMTHWTSASTLTLGPGVTVKSIKVMSPTLIDAMVSIAPGAALGFRTATVSTPGISSDTQSRALFVNIGTLAIAQIAGISPQSAAPGQSLSVAVTGSGTHFQDGITTADFGAGVTVAGVTVTDATHATASIVVTPGAALGFRNVVLTTGSESAALLNGFLVNTATATESLDSVSPSTAAQGQTIDVVIKGTNTSFVPWVSTLDFGPGITFVSASVVDATTMKARIAVASNAAVGAHDVSVTTGTDVVTLAHGFTVTAFTPPPPTLPHSPFGKGYDAFVTTLYAEILGRIPEQTGLNYWSGLLAFGVSPTKVALSIWNSPEHRYLQVIHVAPPIGLFQAVSDAYANASRAAPGLRFGPFPKGPFFLAPWFWFPKK